MHDGEWIDGDTLEVRGDEGRDEVGSREGERRG